MAMDDQKTVKFDDLHWLPPVEAVADLPEAAATGSLCFVQAESAVYAFTDGAWIVEVRQEQADAE